MWETRRLVIFLSQKQNRAVLLTRRWTPLSRGVDAGGHGGDALRPRDEIQLVQALLGEILNLVAVLVHLVGDEEPFQAAGLRQGFERGVVGVILLGQQLLPRSKVLTSHSFFIRSTQEALNNCGVPVHVVYTVRLLL